MEKQTAPVFVKINDYKEVLDIVDVMKQKVKESNETLGKIKALKSEEDQEIKDWEKNLDEITKRLAFIDRAFFENE